MLDSSAPLIFSPSDFNGEPFFDPLVCTSEFSRLFLVWNAFDFLITLNSVCFSAIAWLFDVACASGARCTEWCKMHKFDFLITLNSVCFSAIAWCIQGRRSSGRAGGK